MAAKLDVTSNQYCVVGLTSIDKIEHYLFYLPGEMFYMPEHVCTFETEIKTDPRIMLAVVENFVK